MSVEILHAPHMTGSSEGSLNLLTAAQVIELIRTYQRTPLPDGNRVFPWLHGLSPAVCPQTLYFKQRADHKYMVPELLIPIKVGDSRVQLKNSLRPEDILQVEGTTLIPEFLPTDPEVGVNLRNFKAQGAKCIPHATILVYSFDEPNQVRTIADLIRGALSRMGIHRKVLMYTGSAAEIDEIDDEFLVRQESLPYDSLFKPQFTQWDLNFVQYERLEILHMSKATPIQFGESILYLGNGMDPALNQWETLVECLHYAEMPSVYLCDHHIRNADNFDEPERLAFEFPASDSIDPATLSAKDVVAMLNTCKTVYTRSLNQYSLAFSPEGYRGSTLFAVLYGIYATGQTMAEIITYLHRDCKRPVLCSDGDVEIFRTLEALFREFCPTLSLAKECKGAIAASKVASAFGRLTAKMYEVPVDEFANFNGSLPSRILDYMYLGALRHAQYPDFIVKLGIKKIISVGEKLPWIEYVEGQNTYRNPYPGIEEVLYIPNILDDGVDSLLPILDECLEALEFSCTEKVRTLVHCRVGVSRSAAICIAEVMKRMDWSLPRAYLYVRVRRLNLIIQPNLRLLYDLFKVEEHMNMARGSRRLREMEWPLLCREITRINS